MPLLSSVHYFWSPLLQSPIPVNSLRCRCCLQFPTSGHPFYNPPYLWTVLDAVVFFSPLLLVTPVTILHTCEQSQTADPPSPAPSSLLFTSYLSGAPYYWNEAKSYAHGNVGEAAGLKMMERRTCCCPYQLQPNYRSDVIILTKHFTDCHGDGQCAFKMR